jgi:hypothetical protein
MNFLSFPSRSFLFIIFILFVTSCSVFAQAPSGPPRPHQHPPLPPTDQEQFFAYWTTETGWTTELQLRNNAPGQDLVVTPALRLADGAETALAPVAIKPQEVKSIDLGAAIAAAAAPQLIGTHGSVVLRRRRQAGQTEGSSRPRRDNPLFDPQAHPRFRPHRRVWRHQNLHERPRRLAGHFAFPFRRKRRILRHPENV